MPATIETLRHVVYSQVIASLAPASVEQTQTFMTNLNLPKESFLKFLLLRVSPGLGETSCVGVHPANVLQNFEKSYGSDVDLVAGFYRDGRQKLCWNIPNGCALFAYRSMSGYFNGILCQPLRSIDMFWLFSSAKYGGPKAIRLTNADAALFEAGIYHRSPKFEKKRIVYAW